MPNPAKEPRRLSLPGGYYLAQDAEAPLGWFIYSPNRIKEAWFCHTQSHAEAFAAAMNLQGAGDGRLREALGKLVNACTRYDEDPESNLNAANYNIALRRGAEALASAPAGEATGEAGPKTYTEQELKDAFQQGVDRERLHYEERIHGMREDFHHRTVHLEAQLEHYQKIIMDNTAFKLPPITIAAPALPAPSEGWRLIDDETPKHILLDVTDGEVLVRAKLEECDCDDIGRSLFGWQGEFSDDLEDIGIHPTHYRPASVLPSGAPTGKAPDHEGGAS